MYFFLSCQVVLSEYQYLSYFCKGHRLENRGLDPSGYSGQMFVQHFEIIIKQIKANDFTLRGENNKILQDMTWHLQE